MPRLRPINAPWMISTAAPEIGFRVKSQEGLFHGYVDFLALFTPPKAWRGGDDRYYHVVVVFDSIVSLRMSPEFSGIDRSRWHGYDWGAVPGAVDDNGESESRLNQLDEQWEWTGVCPDPRAYVIEDSDWLVQLGFTSDLPDSLRVDHYLLMGRDHYIEIIAKSMRWEMPDDRSDVS